MMPRLCPYYAHAGASIPATHWCKARHGLGTLLILLFKTLIFSHDVLSFPCTFSIARFSSHFDAAMANSQRSVDFSESRQPQLYGACISTYALAVTAVCLRLSARKYFSKAGIWLDDYAICASLAVASGNFVDMIICESVIFPVT